LTPQGRTFTQARAAEFAAVPSSVLVCGRYEGFDERVRHFVDEEISIGDFVLTGGELAAMCVLEAAVRLLPGVLGNADSLVEESFSPRCGGLLEHPQYTRPPLFRGHEVPAILTSGDHAKIGEWRRNQALERTRRRRPDLLAARPEPELGAGGKAADSSRTPDGSRA
jgi:tRNA (guanine37-N1)-methyltransferase